MVAVIFRLLDALRIFDLIYVLTSNSRDTMSMSVYARQQLVDFQEVGYGSAASTLLFLIVGLCIVLYMTVGTRALGQGDKPMKTPARPLRCSTCWWRRSSSMRSFPFYYAIVTSLKARFRSCSASTTCPTTWTWDNYVAVFREQPFAANMPQLGAGVVVGGGAVAVARRDGGLRAGARTVPRARTCCC